MARRMNFCGSPDHLIDRRGFLEGAAKFAVGGVTAAALLEALSPRFAEAEQVAKTDPRIKAESVEFPSPQGYGTGRGYLVRPASAAPPGGAATPTRGLPVVLVAHENRGLNPHIEDIARRLAVGAPGNANRDPRCVRRGEDHAAPSHRGFRAGRRRVGHAG